jgi:hypothetical protein
LLVRLSVFVLPLTAPLSARGADGLAGRAVSGGDRPASSAMIAQAHASIALSHRPPVTRATELCGILCFGEARMPAAEALPAAVASFGLPWGPDPEPRLLPP